jgi:nitrate reductase gamma subunit
VSAGKILLWIIIPYAAIAIFIVGHWWRYRSDQFDWTSRSTHLLDRRVLGWASPMFHYRSTIAHWWRSIFYLQPDVKAVTGAPLVYQLHAIIAWLFWASFPFSRLVHAWSIPLQYIGRPYILYRRRFPAAPWSTRGAPYRSR